MRGRCCSLMDTLARPSHLFRCSVSHVLSLWAEFEWTHRMTVAARIKTVLSLDGKFSGQRPASFPQ